MARAWRIIEYEGDPEWLARTLRGSVVGEMDCGTGKITELHREITEGKEEVEQANADHQQAVRTVEQAFG